MIKTDFILTTIYLIAGQGLSPGNFEIFSELGRDIMAGDGNLTSEAIEQVGFLETVNCYIAPSPK